MNKMYLSFGSNIEDKLSFLQRGINKIRQNPNFTELKVSSVYETIPISHISQDLFLNIVVELRTSISALEALAIFQQIEIDLYRDRSKTAIKLGSRTIDIDILLFNDEIIRTENLIIPHPRMHQREFVLVPLSELQPNLIINKQNIKSLINKLDINKVTKINSIIKLI